MSVAGSRQRGFTLLELLLVLVVMGLLATLVLPSINLDGAFSQEARMRQAISLLRETRVEALRQGVETRVTLNAATGELHSSLGAQLSLGDRISAQLETARRLVVGERGTVRFFSDGSSTGGRLSLTFDGETRKIDIDWLTGRIGFVPERT